MPKHKPIKFESNLEPFISKKLREIFVENKIIKNAGIAILALIAMGGILSLAMVAPNAIFGIYRLLGLDGKRQKSKYARLWQNFNRLKKNRTIEFVEEKDGYMVYRPTLFGKEKIKKIVFEEMKIVPPKVWDGRWRLVIFDIPEKYKQARNALSIKLVSLGFYQCQRSVWVHPFPCLEEIELIKDLFDIRPFVRVFLVEEMTDGRVVYYFRSLLKKHL